MGGGGRCTVVVPTRNRGARLVRTLVTVLAQDHRDLEILVCDDGSTDDTAARVAALGDPRIRLVPADGSRGSVAAARNRGLAAASGRWVAFCDDDDLWHPSKLSAQVAEMERTGRAWSYCGAVRVDDRFTPISVHAAEDRDLLPDLAYVNGVPGGCSTVVARREAVDAAGGFDPGFSMLADWDLWIRLARQGPAAPWSGLGALYVQHGTQMSTDLSATRDELTRLRAKHADLLAVHPRADTIDGVDVWISDRLRGSGRRTAAVAHTVANLHGVDRYALRMVVRAAAGFRPLRRSPRWPRWGAEVGELVEAVTALGLPPLPPAPR